MEKEEVYVQLLQEAVTFFPKTSLTFIFLSVFHIFLSLNLLVKMTKSHQTRRKYVLKLDNFTRIILTLPLFIFFELFWATVPIKLKYNIRKVNNYILEDNEKYSRGKIANTIVKKNYSFKYCVKSLYLHVLKV